MVLAAATGKVQVPFLGAFKAVSASVIVMVCRFPSACVQNMETPRSHSIPTVDTHLYSERLRDLVFHGH